jgi:hypothetical protein
MAPSIATPAAHFLIGYRNASDDESARRRRTTQKIIPATSVICTPEMVMMWKMPASRMSSRALSESRSRLPVTMAAATAPSSPPTMANTRCASALRARSTAAISLNPKPGGAGGVMASMRPSTDPTAPSLAK